MKLEMESKLGQPFCNSKENPQIVVFLKITFNHKITFVRIRLACPPQIFLFCSSSIHYCAKMNFLRTQCFRQTGLSLNCTSGNPLLKLFEGLFQMKVQKVVINDVLLLGFNFKKKQPKV